ncbi:MAG TPA: PIN domain-containing protein [Allosphingosinicella sp.]|nr:PIN domain-containing protein [Allosphingosinicella sp.]
MLVTDTNILVRCSLGLAMAHVSALRERGVRLATTDRNAAELLAVLVHKLGVETEEAATEVVRVLAPFEVLFGAEYEFDRIRASDRLREGGKSDWPALAAAMALEGEIWSEDVDYFGVGVPVWSTANLHFVEAETP